MHLTCPNCGTSIDAAAIAAARFDSYVNKSAGCWEWNGGRTGAGYGMFGVNQAGVLAHRWNWERHHGPIPKGLLVLHHCDNPPCVRPDHLWLGTQLDNMRDKNAKGRGRYLPSYVRGEAHGTSKLKAVEVEAIRTRYANGGVTLAALGVEYGISKAHVSRIVRRLSWA